MIKIDKIKKFRRINKGFACQNFRKKISGGFTLVETLVAIAIFTTSILGLMLVLAAGIYNTNYAKNKITASYLAQEGIEYIRNMRDTYGLYTAVTGKDWSNFKAKLAPCNLGNECGFDNSVAPIDVKKCNQLNDCKLFFNNNNGSYNSGVGVDSGFARKIWADVIGPDKEIKIFSNVSWTQSSGSYSITFSENLFNWIE